MEEIKRLKKEKEKEKIEAEKEKEEKKLTPAERLAKLKEEMDRKRLESISSGKSELDKTDMKLLFSQKWWFFDFENYSLKSLKRFYLFLLQK